MNSIDVLKEILNNLGLSDLGFPVKMYHKADKRKINNPYYGKNNVNMGILSLDTLKNLLPVGEDFAIDTKTPIGYIPVVDYDGMLTDEQIKQIMILGEASKAYVLESSPGKNHVYLNRLLDDKKEFFTTLINAKLIDQAWAEIYLKGVDSGGYIRICGTRPDPKLIRVVES